MKSRNSPILSVAATLGATALLFRADNLAPSETADTIYHGGSIITISRPDQRGEHAFSTFIRQATAEDGSARYAHHRDNSDVRWIHS
jgi:hypothetical protein